MTLELSLTAYIDNSLPQYMNKTRYQSSKMERSQNLEKITELIYLLGVLGRCNFDYLHYFNYVE